MRSHTLGRLALLTGASVLTVALPTLAPAQSMRNGGPTTPPAATGTLPGQVQWGHYETSLAFDADCTAPGSDSVGCDHGGNGDNILRLVNPNGAANPSISGQAQTVCAMIYVFDNDEEMGECCGCPISSAGSAAFSVEGNLLSNFIGDPPGDGLLAIVAAPQSTALISFDPSNTNGKGCLGSNSGACNIGCDPTNVPGYRTSSAANLLGSITRNQILTANSGASIAGLSETPLFGDAGGQPDTMLYLQGQCGAILGNSHTGGFCNCPPLE